MVRLLIIADDFTGALDTGIQFAKRGCTVRVRALWNTDSINIETDAEVLVIDSETRHKTGEEAHCIVSNIVRRALKWNIPYIYKKTDSVLRGNVGAELSALCDQTGDNVHFAPAFPIMGRVTRKGIQYVNGIPIAQSVFGKDPFDPVTSSDVVDIIRQEASEPVKVIDSDEVGKVNGNNCIYVYNAETDEELGHIADCLLRKNERFFAGCAGFAEMLSEKLFPVRQNDDHVLFPAKLLMMCGSVNPVTVRQMQTAENKGIPREHLTNSMRMDTRWIETEEADLCFRRWIEVLKEKNALILDVNRKNCESDQEKEQSIEPKNRTIVSENLGSIIKCLLDRGVEATLLLSGGDTLFAAMKAVAVDELEPIKEIVPGIVVSRFLYCGRLIYCASKSGGFGGESILLDLIKSLQRQDTTNYAE